MTGEDSKIASVADLEGKRVAVTRNTDPHIFLVRTLLGAGLTEKDITSVLLQHADGKTALIVREQFLKDYPDAARRVLAVHEEARCSRTSSEVC